jgi:hypothetical protein
MDFHCLRKNESTILSARLMKLMTYSDSSWKTASESLGIEKNVQIFMSPYNVLERAIV